MANSYSPVSARWRFNENPFTTDFQKFSTLLIYCHWIWSFEILILLIIFSIFPLNTWLGITILIVVGFDRHVSSFVLIQCRRRTELDKHCDLNFLLALMIRFPNLICLKWLFHDRFKLISFYFVAEWVWFPSTFLQKRKILIYSYLGTMFNYSDCVPWMNRLFFNGPDIPNSSKKKRKCRQPTCKWFFYLWRHWVKGDIV